MEGNEDSEDVNESILTSEAGVFDDHCNDNETGDEYVNSSAEYAEGEMETNYSTAHFARNYLYPPKAYTLDHNCGSYPENQNKVYCAGCLPSKT